MLDRFQFKDDDNGWLERNEGSCVPAGLRGQTSRVRLAQKGAIAGARMNRLRVFEVGRGLTRMRRAGLGDSAMPTE